jgi:hypothetical protein
VLVLEVFFGDLRQHLTLRSFVEPAYLLGVLVCDPDGGVVDDLLYFG